MSLYFKRFRAAVRFAPLIVCICVLLKNTAAQTCFREWQAAPNGASGTVNCMTSWDPDGAGPLAPVLVIGGSFTSVGTIAANNIAYWDGAWHAFGSGLDGSIASLAVMNGTLYAGGGFTHSGPTAIDHIARWTGSAWQGLAGGGTNQSVASMVVNGSDLYVGGSFVNVAGGSISSKYIARYNGTSNTWHSFPDLGWGSVSQLAFFNGQVIMACNSLGRSIGDTIIMQWNGSNNWNSFASCDMFGGMIVYGPNLYYSGYFFNASVPQHQRHNIRRWNATSSETVQNQVRALKFGLDNGQLIVTGRRFDDHDPTTDWNYTYNGSIWAPWASMPTIGGTGTIYSLHEHTNGTLYCGGSFGEISNVQMSNIAQLAGSQWQPLSVGLNALVRGAASYNGELYIGGDFSSLGTVNATGIMKYDGTNWRAVPFSALNAAVTTLFTFNSNTLALPSLAVGGFFTSADGQTVNRVVLYDSQDNSWTPLGTGLNSTPYAFTTIRGTTAFRNNLVVGGTFTTAGGVPINRIARYVSGAWQGFGTGMNSDVRALANFNGNVTAGGVFTSANGVACNRIAQWDGTTFVPLGSGLNNTVYALQVFDSKLIAAGDFTTAGGMPAVRVAQWDGATWAPMGDGFNSTVFTLAIVDNTLVAGGFFTASGSTPLNYMAQWNGTAWTTLSGSGPDNWVLAMAVNPSGTLVAGGTFTHVSGEFSPYAAISVPPSTLAITNHPVDAAACAGDAATFNITTNGGIFSGTTYRWTRNYIDLADGPTASGSLIDGVHTSTLHIENVQPQDAGQYRCVADRCSQTAVSNPAALSIIAGPNITTQPTAEGACMGEEFTLFVEAGGVNPLSYAWFKDGVPIGSNSNLLFFPILGQSNAGTYQCLISNGDGCGRTSTIPVVLDVRPCCAADFNHDGIVDFFDYLDFVQAFASNDPSSDFNNDAVIDFFDYLDFVQAFSQGC